MYIIQARIAYNILKYDSFAVVRLLTCSFRQGHNNNIAHWYNNNNIVLI